MDIGTGRPSIKALRSFDSSAAEPTLLLGGDNPGKYFGDFQETSSVRVPEGQGVGIFNDGTRYSGGWRGGKYHGIGCIVTSAFEADGTWEDDQLHGRGAILYKDSVVGFVLRGISMITPFEASSHKPLHYNGELHRTHHRHGKGKMVYRNDDVYEGEWEANRKHGHGVMKFASGEKYDGMWVQDERSGIGTAMYPNGSVFTGTLKADKRVGEGVLKFPNGDEYRGNFDNDKMTGSATMTYRNGDVYVGEWYDGVRQGKGQFSLGKTGATMSGTFYKGLIHGIGTVDQPQKSYFIGEFIKGERANGTLWSSTDRSCYQGEWRGEYMHGKGLKWYGNGDLYFGLFQSSVRHGPGGINFSDGSSFRGEFKNDARGGKGIVQSADGSIAAGVWAGDTLVSGYRGEWNGQNFTGIGSLFLANGDNFFGTFSGKGLREGKGIMKFRDGRCAKGDFAKDHLDGFGSFSYARGASASHNGGTPSSPATSTLKRSQSSSKMPLPACGDDALYVGQWRDSRRSGAGRVTDKYGNMFTGTFRDDYASGAGAFFACDERQPIYEDPPNATNTASSSANDLTALGRAANDGRTGGALMTPTAPANNNAPTPDNAEEEAPLKTPTAGNSPAAATTPTSADAAGSTAGGILRSAFSMFSWKKSANDTSAADQQSQRKIIGYERQFIFSGEWAGNPSAASTSSSSGGGGGPGASSDASNAVDTSTLGATSKGTMFFLDASSAVVPPPTASGSPSRPLRALSAFSGTWSCNRLKLEVPHRGNAISATTDDASGNQPAGSSKKSAKCTFCQSTFGFFKKELSCTVCDRASCANCLRETKTASGFTATLCAECIECAKMALCFGTAWVRMLVDQPNGNSKRPSRLPSAMPSRADSRGGSPVQQSQQDSSPAPRHVDPTTDASLIGGVNSPGRTMSVERDAHDPNAIMRDLLVYRGFFAGNKPHGNGTLWHSDRSCYHGEFCVGRKSGQGVLTHSNGERYLGSWVDDSPGGLGTYLSCDGIAYHGVWTLGKLQRILYQGEVDEDLARNGRGVAFMDDGSRYNGEWYRGVRHGTGILQFASGKVYSGQFAFDRMDGMGKIMYDSHVHVGLFENGVRHGRGTSRFGDRDVMGVWAKDVLNGVVTVKNRVSGDAYDAMYHDSKERTDMFMPVAMKPDEMTTECDGCNASFSFFLRKHHCRMCGDIFCDKCTKRRIALPAHFGHSDVTQRVCMRCYIDLSEGCSIGIKRYADGSVYAGCWCNGAWKGRGLFKKAPAGPTATPQGDTDTGAVSSDRVSSSADDHASPRYAIVDCGESSKTMRAMAEAEEKAGRPPRFIREVDEANQRRVASQVEPSTADDVAAFEQWWQLLMRRTHSLPFPLLLHTVVDIMEPLVDLPVELKLFSEMAGSASEADLACMDRQSSFVPAIIPTAPAPPFAHMPQWPAPVIAQSDEELFEEISFLKKKRQPHTEREAASTTDDRPPQEAVTSLPPPPINPPTPARPRDRNEEDIKMEQPWAAWDLPPIPQYSGVAENEWASIAAAPPMLKPEHGGMDRIHLVGLEGPQHIRVSVSRSRGVQVLQQLWTPQMQSEDPRRSIESTSTGQCTPVDGSSVPTSPSGRQPSL